jgi:Bcr/CflA subfamily drug resistance transporter
MINSKKQSVVVVALFSCILGFVALFGSDLYLPALPAMQHYFSTSVGMMEWSVSIYMVGCGIAAAIYGPLSDFFGRKPIVIIGLSIACIGALAALFSQNIPSFLIARLIQGFGAGAAYSMFRVMLRDVIKGKQMAQLASYTTMMFNLSPVLGLTIGGYLVHYLNWQACFIVLAITYALLVLIYALACPETISLKTPFQIKKIIPNYQSVLTNQSLIGIAICSGFAFSAIFAFATTGAFIFQKNFHMSPLTFGWLGGFLSLASIAGKFLNASLVKHFKLQQLMQTSMIGICLAGLLLLILPHNSITVLGCFILATGSTALFLSNAMSLAMQHHQTNIGYVASAYGSIQLMVVFISNSILAHCNHFGIISVSSFFIVIALISLSILRFIQ